MSKEIANTCEVRIRIPEKIYKDFATLAEYAGLSVNEVTEQLIINYMEKMNEIMLAVVIVGKIEETEKTEQPKKLETPEELAEFLPEPERPP